MNIRYPLYEGVYRILTNYGRKSYDYGEISTLLWGEQPANT